MSKKKKFVLSAVSVAALSSMPVGISLASAFEDTRENIVAESREMMTEHIFKTVKSYTVDGISGLKLSFRLTEGNFTELSNNKVHFQLSGDVSFSNGLNYVSTFNDDTDGVMLFSLIHEDQYSKVYRGYTCSSSGTGCATEKYFELLLLKKENVWKIDFNFKRANELYGKPEVTFEGQGELLQVVKNNGPISLKYKSCKFSTATRDFY